MADQAGGKASANDAAVKSEPNGPERPTSVPESYVWDPEMGATGAWREPTTEEGK